MSVDFLSVPVAMRLPRDRRDPFLAPFGRSSPVQRQPDDLELVLPREDRDGAPGTEPHGLAFADLTEVELVALHLLSPRIDSPFTIYHSPFTIRHPSVLYSSYHKFTDFRS